MSDSDYKHWYEEAMVASNEAGFAGVDAASAIRWLSSEVQRLEKINETAVRLLRGAKEVVDHANTETGYCCCGTAMDAHTLGDGHSPVDQGNYAAMVLLSEVVGFLTEHEAASDPTVADLCGLCGKPQFSTPSGVVCENGHGGAEPA